MLKKRRFLMIDNSSNRPIGQLDVKWCSFWIMPLTTTPGCTPPGGRPTPNAFPWSSCRPYSPELNPIERVWKFTRRRCLHNRYFPQLEQVIEAVEWEFAGWARHK